MSGNNFFSKDTYSSHLGFHRNLISCQPNAWSVPIYLISISHFILSCTLSHILCCLHVCMVFGAAANWSDVKLAVTTCYHGHTHKHNCSLLYKWCTVWLVTFVGITFYESGQNWVFQILMVLIFMNGSQLVKKAIWYANFCDLNFANGS